VHCIGLEIPVRADTLAVTGADPLVPSREQEDDGDARAQLRSLNPNSISMNNLSTIATVATASQVVPHVGIVREAGNDIVSGVSNSFVQINLGLLSKFAQTIWKSRKFHCYLSSFKRNIDTDFVRPPGRLSHDLRHLEFLPTLTHGGLNA
jgi:hypothetical protein